MKLPKLPTINKARIARTLVLAMASTGVCLFLLIAVNEFFLTHYFAFHQPIRVNLALPITVEDRPAMLSPLSEDATQSAALHLEVKAQEPVYDSLKEEISAYICSKGWNCRQALLIAECESGIREDAVNINKDRSVDAGVFQINLSAHKDVNLKEMLDFKKNIDKAARLWTHSGWGPWVCARKLGIK